MTADEPTRADGVSSLGIVIVCAPSDDQGAAREAAGRCAHALGIEADVTVTTATMEYAAAVTAAIARTSGAYVLVTAPAALADLATIERVWRERQTAGLVLGRERAAGAVGRRQQSTLRLARRALSLPVRPDATIVLARRAALAHVPASGGRFEWLLETIVTVNADGWPIVRAIEGEPGAPPDVRVGLAALWRLWVLRNSAFSADYDERAYNSLIPLQRYWQRTRYRLITGFVDPSTHILDIGCGSSRIVQALPHAVGLDIQLKKLRRIAGSTRKLVQATLTRLPFRDAAFETLICSQVIEHVPEPLVDWREFNRVLEEGGTLVVGTPDYATFTWPILEWLYGLVHPKGYVNEHINRYTADSLTRALDAHGFTVEEAAYVGGGELIYKARKTRSL